MKSISFISLVAMLSIFIALIYLIINDSMKVAQQETIREHKLVDFGGIPYYFGTAMFMFEGNAIALEIFH